MEQTNYHCSITAGITPQDAYANIASVNAWWTKSFRGRATHAGDTFTIQFGETKVAFQIAEAIPGKKVVWHVTDCYLHWLNNKTEWNNTDIVWDITPKNGETQIDMTHVGFAPGIECYDSCRKGWDGYIAGSLLQLVTQGKGQPD